MGFHFLYFGRFLWWKIFSHYLFIESINAIRIFGKINYYYLYLYGIRVPTTHFIVIFIKE